MLPDSSSYYTSSIVEEWALGVSQGDEPQSFSDALGGAEEKEWRLAIDSELASVEETRLGNLVFYLKTVMQFRSNGSSKES